MAILEGTSGKDARYRTDAVGTRVATRSGSTYDKYLAALADSRKTMGGTPYQAPTFNLPDTPGSPPGGGSTTRYGGASTAAIGEALKGLLGGGYDASGIQNAIGTLSGRYQNIGSNLSSGYQNALQTILGAYQDAPVNQTFDRYGQDVANATQLGQTRLQDIINQMTNRSATADQRVQEAMAQGDSRLAALGQGAINEQRNGSADLARQLAAQGVQGGVSTETTPLAALIQASRATNANTGNLFAQAGADRGAIYGGLQADVGAGLTRDATALDTLIASQRAKALDANRLARAQATSQFGTREADMLAQLGQSQLQGEMGLMSEQRAAEQAIADRNFQIRQALAQMGIQA